MTTRTPSDGEDTSGGQPGSAGQGRVRVLLADDEAMIRAGVRAILGAAEDVEVVAEAADGRAAVDLTLRHRPDVCLLDIRMPRLDGLRAAAELRRAAPDTAVMMLTTFSEDDHIASALGSGAAGFVLKSGDPHELIAGVRAVAAGGAYLSPTIARRVISQLNPGALGRRTEALARTEVLTAREREVLALVGAGLSNAEIAAELHVVEGTVKTYVSQILARLEMKNRVQAAVLAHEAGLVREAGGSGG